MKDKYEFYSSWAVWANEGTTPKSNIGDLSVLDPDVNDSLLTSLNPNIILVALNISRGDIQYPLANFHDKRSEATDYKLRFALRGTKLWGAYLTDIIKDFDFGHSHSYYSKTDCYEPNPIGGYLLESGNPNSLLIKKGKEIFLRSKKIIKKGEPISVSYEKI